VVGGFCALFVLPSDKEAPQLTCPGGGGGVTINTSTGQNYGTYQWIIGVTDNSQQNLSSAVVCSISSPANFSHSGSPHSVSCNASDNSSNTGVCSFDVTVTGA